MMRAGDQSSLSIARLPVGIVGRRSIHRNARTFSLVSQSNCDGCNILTERSANFAAGCCTIGIKADAEVLIAVQRRAFVEIADNTPEAECRDGEFRIGALKDRGFACPPAGLAAAPGRNRTSRKTRSTSPNVSCTRRRATFEPERFEDYNETALLDLVNHQRACNPRRRSVRESHRDLRPALAPQSRVDRPRRQLMAPRQAKERPHQAARR
jgi:hypothetical protein